MLRGATLRASAMVGTAVFRIVVSSASMKKATAISHGRNCFTGEGDCSTGGCIRSRALPIPLLQEPVAVRWEAYSMAALPDSAPGYVVDLRSISAPALNSLLEEEGAIWRKDFSWDFRASADLVRKFVDLKALTGFALVRGNEVVGYSYYVCEEGKGLIGDLYVRPFPDQMQDENQLLAAVMEALWRTPGTTRIEAQLMMLRNTLNRAVPYPTWFRSYPRRFYEASLESMASVGPQRQILGIHIIPWSEMKQEESADLIARSYVGHIDSEINDQYRSA